MKASSTLVDFESEFGVRPFSEGIETTKRVYVSPSEELMKLVFEWDADGDCSNKYVKLDSLGYSSWDEEKQFFRYKFENGDIIVVGLIGNNSSWDYLGFSNLKYGIELSFHNRETGDMRMFV